MAYTYDQNKLVEGSIMQVDTAPRYPLGFTVEDKTGKTFKYVKATAALTAGTSVAETGYTAVAGLTAKDGGATFTGSTPASATAEDLIGQLVKVTRSNSVIGVFPVVDGEGSTLVIPEVKSGDTLALVAYAHGLAGGTGTALLPVASIASGSYGFVLEA